MDCWSNGMRVEKLETWDSFFKENLNCVLKTDTGKFVYLRAKDQVIRSYIETLPIYEASNLPDGISTWILYSHSDGVVKFAGIKVQSAFEVGTSHKILAMRVSAQKIHGAGELLKQDRSVKFNTQSGTYTHEWISSKMRKSKCSGEELEDIIKNKVSEFLKIYSLSFSYDTFITKNIPVTNIEITRLRNAGFVVEDFEDMATCKSSLKTSIAQRHGAKRTRRMRRKKTRKTKKVF